jgi:hypothetical protein
MDKKLVVDLVRYVLKLLLERRKTCSVFVIDKKTTTPRCQNLNQPHKLTITPLSPISINSDTPNSSSGTDTDTQSSNTADVSTSTDVPSWRNH